VEAFLNAVGLPSRAPPIARPTWIANSNSAKLPDRPCSAGRWERTRLCQQCLVHDPTPAAPRADPVVGGRASPTGTPDRENSLAHGTPDLPSWALIVPIRSWLRALHVRSGRLPASELCSISTRGASKTARFKLHDLDTKHETSGKGPPFGDCPSIGMMSGCRVAS
jgi:hypothetical protein